VNPGLPEELKPSKCHVVFYEVEEDLKNDMNTFRTVDGDVPVHVDVVALEDSEHYKMGESMDRWVVRKMVEVVKARGCTVAVLNKGKGKLV